MRFLQVELFLAFVVVANGGKVDWGSNGKPKIDTSSDSGQGCRKATLASYVADKNVTSSCSK